MGFGVKKPLCFKVLDKVLDKQSDITLTENYLKTSSPREKTSYRGNDSKFLAEYCQMPGKFQSCIRCYTDMWNYTHSYWLGLVYCRNVPLWSPQMTFTPRPRLNPCCHPYYPWCRFFFSLMSRSSWSHPTGWTCSGMDTVISLNQEPAMPMSGNPQMFGNANTIKERKPSLHCQCNSPSVQHIVYKPRNVRGLPENTPPCHSLYNMYII